MNKKLKISIVIPTIVKNKKWLTETIISVLKNKPYEIIVVVSNIKQKKEIIEILNEVNNKKIIKVILQRHKFLNGARYDGALAAKGDIVAFVDDDVILPKGYLDRIKNLFEKDKELVGITASKRFSNESQKKFGIISRKHSEISNTNVLEGNFMAIKRSQLIKAFRLTQNYFYIQPADDTLLSLILSKKFGYKLIKYGEIIHNEGSWEDELKRHFKYGEGELKLIKWLNKNKIHKGSIYYEVLSVLWILGFSILFISILSKNVLLFLLLLFGYILFYSKELSKFKTKNKFRALLFLTLTHIATIMGFTISVLKEFFKFKNKS